MRHDNLTKGRTQFEKEGGCVRYRLEEMFGIEIGIEGK